MMKTLKILSRAAAAAAGFAALAVVLVPAPAAADFVINDDLIVDGSACIGFDCVNGESFGFDTIRLKENNLRIKAEDTSTAASYPTQDWQLTFNDSANGGANKFSVECVSPGSSTPFTVEGCAPSHSLFVDDGGRIGFGTSTPVVELHVKDGDTPTLRLEQDGSSGFTPQTWDVAGNETNFFIRDVTNGSRLPLRIRPGAETSSIDIQANGDVFFDGDSDGDLRLRLQSGSGAGDFAEFTFTEGTTNEWGFGRFQDDNSFYVFNYQGGTNQYAMYIDAENDFGLHCRTNTNHDLTINSGNASCTAGTFSQIDAGEAQFTTSSSRTIKENLEPVEVDGLLDRIADVGVYTYDFIAGKKNAIGVMAEDFHQVFGRGSDKLLSGHEMQVALWLAVQELTARNEELSTYTRDQQETIEALKARLAALEEAR